MVHNKTLFMYISLIIITSIGGMLFGAGIQDKFGRDSTEGMLYLDIFGGLGIGIVAFVMAWSIANINKNIIMT